MFTLRAREALLKSLLSIYPLSAYLWTFGMFLTGAGYLMFPELVTNQNIPLVYDRLWGVAVAAASVALLVAMRKADERKVRSLCGLLFLASVSLLIPSIVDTHLIAIVSSSLSIVFYAYMYLCSPIILDWRLIEKIRIGIIYSNSVDHSD